MRMPSTFPEKSSVYCAQHLSTGAVITSRTGGLKELRDLPEGLKELGDLNRFCFDRPCNMTRPLAEFLPMDTLEVFAG